MKHKIILFGALLSLLYHHSGSAQISDDVIKEVDLRIKHGVNHSIVVGVFDKGRSNFYTQGWQNKAEKIPVSTDSVYEIGSITKTYTSLLLAIMSEKHGFNINDTVQSHWPKLFKLEDQKNQAITFKHLATHTSGLPRLPGNLNLFSNDPYADYGRNEMIKGVIDAQPKIAGSKYNYSNFGAGLLGESMAVIGKESYNELIIKHILEPLNLTGTYMTLDTVPKTHLVQGYAGNSTTNAWRFQALAGAGSIRSSIKDLLAYGVAYLGPNDNHLADAMKLATSVQYHTDEVKMGLGWHFSHSGHLWHNGATGGFSSILIINPNQQKVVAAITNDSISTDTNIEDIAMHLMDSSMPMRDFDFPVEIGGIDLQDYTGDFERAENQQKIQISIQSDQLIFDAKNLKDQPLIYIGEDEFKFNLVKIKVKFIRD